jgi:hypothetical protein
VRRDAVVEAGFALAEKDELAALRRPKNGEEALEIFRNLTISEKANVHGARNPKE